jgi:hypothetical protein
MAMQWPELKSRELGIPWPTKSGAAIDPYLVWADATNLAGVLSAAARAQVVDLETGEVKIVPIAFELAAGTSFSQLKRAVKKEWGEGVPWGPITIGTRFATALVPMTRLASLYESPLQDLIARFELGLPTRAPKRADKYVEQVLGQGAADIESIPGTVTYAAVIDDGCAFANKAFVNRHKTGHALSRIHRLWFQEDKRPIDPKGKHLGYAKRHLDLVLLHAHAAGVQEEDAAYDVLAYNLRSRGLTEVATDWRRQMRLPAAHGTHVLDVMTGSPNPLARPRYAYGKPIDAAATAPIIFVQLPRAAVADTSGGSMNCHVLEALAYVAGAVKPPHEVVINLSYGALAGPHDGSTLLEEAIDHFLEHNPRVRTLTLPAGNGYDSRTHARLWATPDARWQEMSLQVLPDDPTDTFVEIWYEPRDSSVPGLAVIDVEIVSPAGHRSGAVPVGKFIEWCDPRAKLPTAALMHVAHPTGGAGRKHMALLALAPTRPPDPARGSALHGEWIVRIQNRGGRGTIVDAWIERDDSPFGSGRSRSQSTFLSAGVAPAPGHPHGATFPIERRMCLNSFAHGEKPEVAGGYSLRSTVAAAPGDPIQAVAKYSASGPGRKGVWPGPNVCAPSEESPAIGLVAAGTRSAQPAYMNGTSVASAALARQRINGVAPSTISPPQEDLPPKKDHPGGPYADPMLRRGAGRLEPAP